PLDPALFVAAREAHVRAVHGARQATPAPAAHGEDGEVARADAFHRLPHLHDLAQHLVADDELVATGRRFGTPARGFLAVGPADPDAQDAQRDLVRRGDFGPRALDQPHLPRAGDDGEGLHGVPPRARVDVGGCGDVARRGDAVPPRARVDVRYFNASALPPARGEFRIRCRCGRGFPV